MTKSSKDTINSKTMISLIKLYHPEYDNKTIEDILDSLEEVIIYGIETDQKIKFGKLFTIQGVIRKPSKHYNGISGDKDDPYVMLPERLRIKFSILQGLKKVENNYKPK